MSKRQQQEKDSRTKLTHESGTKLTHESGNTPLHDGEYLLNKLF
jgi:hypothetical protein